MKKLAELAFDNTYSRLGEAFGSRVLPTPTAHPQLVAFNPDAARLLDLDPSVALDPEFLRAMSGASLLPGSDPLAMAYAGHQFGVPVRQLGDGRAILLGQVREGRDSWDLHLKGCGETPFSRRGDGRAVLRSCIREYLCGETMHGLGIPTTRSLCIVGSGEMVFRESVEGRGLLLRMAPSHVRFGSFEYFMFKHHREPELMHARLAELADYVIHQHFPEILAAFPVAGPERYGAFLREVSVRTARLVANWQAVGWAHGVLNTDNMSILGLTLDYGPFGFMDDYDPGFIPNHSDEQGRYAFDQQPSIGLWNLNALAQACLPLMNESIALSALEAYEPEFHQTLGQLLRAKLGLREAKEADVELYRELFTWMEISRVDYTRFFRRLGSDIQNPSDASDLDATALSGWAAWSEKYRARLQGEGWNEQTALEREQAMNRVNPKFVLRNYLAQRAIDEATQKGNFSEIELLWKLLRDPYSEHPEMEDYAQRPPDWGKHIVVSCSS